MTNFLYPPPFDSQYSRVMDDDVVAAVHNDWVEQLGELTQLFEELAGPGSPITEGRPGQGYTKLLEVGGVDMFAKLYLPDRPHRRMRDLFGMGRALLEWKANCAAAEAGIPIPTVVLAMTTKRFLACKHLMLTLPANGTCARDLLREAEGEERRRLLRHIGEVVADWHRRGFIHAHLNVQHLFIDEDDKVQVIDLESSRVMDPAPDDATSNNLRQMQRSLEKTFRSSEGFDDFLEAYNAAKMA